MNKKELMKFKKSWKPENNSIIRVYAACVSPNEAKLLECTLESVNMDTSEMAVYLKLFNKALSGKEGDKLFTLSIPDEMDTVRQQLSLLRDSGLRDENAVDQYINGVMESVVFETNTVLMLAYGEYLIPESGGKIFPYVIGLVCPIKPAKETLYYNSKESSISTMLSSLEVNAAEDSFMYPALANNESIDYEVVYAKKSSKNNGEFAELVLGCTLPVQGDIQKLQCENIIKKIYRNPTASDVQSIYKTIHTKIKENDALTKELLYLDKDSLKKAFIDAGASDEQMADFDSKYNEIVGQNKSLQADLIINNKKFVIQDDDMKLELKPDETDRFTIVEENGQRFIKIPVHKGMIIDGVEV